MPQSPSKQAPWDLTQFSNCHQQPRLYLPESHRQSEIFKAALQFLYYPQGAQWVKWDYLNEQS